MEINEATQRFIADNRDGDVRQLALRGSRTAGVDLPFALDQIRGRQVAASKMPRWAATEGIVYPPHLSLEQSSGEPAALYKTALAGSGDRYVDLTGGMGGDFSIMSARFGERIYVERNALLCRLARHNLPLLGIEAEVVEADAESYLRQMMPADVVFIDPARRSDSGSRTYALADCSPNVLDLLPLLNAKARCVIMKLSPMLDWHKAVADIEGQVSGGKSHESSAPEGQEDGKCRLTVAEVHILSVANECKELVLVMRQGAGEQPLRLVCSNDGTTFSCLPSEQAAPTTAAEPQAGQWLYVPNASVMKGGCFGAVSRQFGIGMVAANSHLFCSETQLSESFPGRCFRIESTSTMNRRQLKTALSGITQANISCRNFPIDVAALRRKLRLADGGDTYIFATTTALGTHLLLFCKAVKP